MVGFGRCEQKKLECPFCRKGMVNASFKEAFIQASSSSISAGKKYTYARKPEKWTIVEDCPQCGAKKKDIQEVYDRGKKPETREERMKRLKSAGIPTVVEI